jgi:hypothetical protein
MEAIIMTPLHELTALPVKVRAGLVKALSEKSSAWFTYCTRMRPSGMRPTWSLLRHLLPVGVTLKRNEGLSRRATRCFAAAQHDTLRQLQLMHIRAEKLAPTDGRNIL